MAEIFVDTNETKMTDEERKQDYIRRLNRVVESKNLHFIKEPDKLMKLKAELADRLQASWQSSYASNPANYTDVALNERWRKTTDDKWGRQMQSLPKDNPLRAHYMKKDDDTIWVDISAIRKNSDLPLDRQQENAKAADFVINLIQRDLMAPGDIIDEGYLEKAAAEVHSGWKDRNPSAQQDAPQMWVDYNQLSEELKNKDREHVVLALEVLKESSLS